MDIINNQQDLILNLRDSGCDQKTIETYLHLYNARNFKESTMILKKWRQTLLENLHTCQRQLDCLDYMLRIYQKEGLYHEE